MRLTLSQWSRGEIGSFENLSQVIDLVYGGLTFVSLALSRTWEMTQCNPVESQAVAQKSIKPASRDHELKRDKCNIFQFIKPVIRNRNAAFRNALPVYLFKNSSQL